MLRGSASMLFGRGSTGGVVNQVSKAPLLANINEVSTTVGSGSYLRLTGDFNLKTSETSALRLNVMTNTADNYGNYDRQGRHRADLPLGHRHRRRVLGRLLTTSTTATASTTACRGCAQNDSGGRSARRNPGGLIKIDPKNYYGAASDYSAGYAVVRHAPATRTASRTAASGTRCCAAAATTATSAPRRSASACARPTRDGRRHQSRLHRRSRRRQDDDQRRDAAEPRHQQQGAGPARDLPADRLHEHVQLVRPQERGARRRRLRARGVQQLHAWSCRPASSSTRTIRARRSARRTTAPRSTRALRQKVHDAQLRRQGARRLRPGPGRGRAALEGAGRPALGPLRGRLRQPADRNQPGRSRARARIRSGASRFGVLWQPSRDELLLRLVRHLVQHLGRALQLRRARARTRRRRRAATSRSAPSSTCSRAACRPAVAIFHSTKYNERNRDSPDGQPLERLRPLGQAPRRRRRARPGRPHHAGLGGVPLVRLDSERRDRRGGRAAP